MYETEEPYFSYLFCASQDGHSKEEKGSQK